MRCLVNTSQFRNAALVPGLVGAYLVLCQPLSGQKSKPRATWKAHKDAVISLAFNPDGNTLASGGADNFVKLWHVATGRNTRTWKAAGAFGWCSVAFSPDGKMVASGGGGNLIKIWNVATGKSNTILDDTLQYASPAVLFSPDGKILVSGGMYLYELKLWDISVGKNTFTLEGFDRYGVEAMGFTPDGKTLVTVTRFDGIKLWDVGTGKRKKPILKHGEKTRIQKLIRCLGSHRFRKRKKAARQLEALGPQALDLLREASRHQDVEISRRAARLVALLEARIITAPCVLCAAFNPKGMTLATAIPVSNGDEDGSDGSEGPWIIKLGEIASGKHYATLQGHTSAVTCMVFSGDGKTLASGSKDGTIKLWDAANGKELMILQAHTKPVLSLAFSPDGRMLASGSADTTIKLWDVGKGK
jgi:WD40 repeat protein